MGKKQKEKKNLDNIAKRFSTSGYLECDSLEIIDPGGWDINAKMTEFSFRTMKPHFRGPSCLEIACCDGGMTESLLDSFDRVAAIDGSSVQIERLKEKISSDKLETHVSLIEEFETNELFSTIIMSYILEHVDDPVGCIRHVSKFLAPGGVILIVVPNGHSVHRKIALQMGLIDDLTQFSYADIFSGHRRTYVPETIGRDIEAAGLRVAGVDGVLFKPLSQKQMEDWFTDEMLEGFFLIGKEFPEICSSIFLKAEK